MSPPTSEVVRLFPTFVWQSRLEPACYEPLNRDLLAQIETLMGASAGARKGAAWQSGYALHRKPEFASAAQPSQQFPQRRLLRADAGGRRYDQLP
jgi:hypothetical protein